jgi:hypothetical protein
MSIDIMQRLKARREAQFHVQVELESIPSNILTPSEVSLLGRVIRIFRSDGRLGLRDEVAFTIRVCKTGDEIRPGSSYLLYDELIGATHIEVYLNGNPPHCEIPIDEFMILEAPSAEPRMAVSELEELIASREGKRKIWWQFWKL